jgi:hypothetical protein
MNDLLQAIQGLTERELHAIVECLCEKNSVSSNIKKLLDKKNSLKKYADLIQNEIRLMGRSTIMNFVKDEALQYRDIRLKTALSLGYKGKNYNNQKISKFLLFSKAQHKHTTMTGAVFKSLIIDFIPDGAAMILLEKIVPIIERSYKYNFLIGESLTEDISKAIKKNDLVELDLVIERISPRNGKVIQSNWTSTRKRLDYNFCFPNLLISDEIIFAEKSISEVWEEAVKNPEKKYTDVASVIIGVKAGESATKEFTDGDDFFNEAVETLLKQIRGELPGVNKKGDVSPQQFKGNIFERLQVLYFNKNAKAADSSVRAYTTDDIGLKNHTLIDIVALSPDDKFKFDQLEDDEAKEAFLYSLSNHWQAKCNDKPSDNINSLKKYQSTGFLGNFSEKQILKELGKTKFSTREKDAFIENYENHLNAYDIKGASFTAQEAIEIAKSDGNKLSAKAQEILLKKINAKMKGLHKEVINSATSAALLGGVLAAVFKLIECRNDKRPFKVVIKEISIAAASGALKSGVQAALVTYVTANAIKFSIRNGLGSSKSKIIGNAAGTSVVFIIECGYDLYEYKRGNINHHRLVSNLGNKLLSTGLIILISNTKGGKILQIIGGMVGNNVIQSVDPFGHYIFSNYDSILATI